MAEQSEERSVRPRRLGLVHRKARNTVRHIGLGDARWPRPLCGSGDRGGWAYRTGKDVHALPLCGWCLRDYEAISAALSGSSGGEG